MIKDIQPLLHRNVTNPSTGVDRHKERKGKLQINQIYVAFRLTDPELVFKSMRAIFLSPVCRQSQIETILYFWFSKFKKIPHFMNEDL